MPLKASVIILGYNGRRYLDACLASVFDQTMPSSDYEVVYVDNGSSDDSLAYIQAHFPQARTLDLKRNLGFARGNNAAVEHAHGQYLVFLNQDTIVHRDWLAALVRAMDADARLGACHANMIMPWSPEFTGQTRDKLPEHVYIIDLTRWGHAGYHSRPMQVTLLPATFLSGACFILRRTLLGQLSYLFDESFFMYAEDLDLALRIRALGWQMALIPDAVFYHLHDDKPAVGARQFYTAYWATRNRLLAYYKVYFGLRFWLDWLPRLLVGAPLKVWKQQKGLGKWLLSAAMLPVTLAALASALVRMPNYRQERNIWQHRIATMLPNGNEHLFD